MTAVKKVIAMRQLDSMFGNLTLEGEGRHSPLVSSVIEHDPRCDVHGRCSTSYRSSLYLHSRESTPGYFRDAISPTNGLIIRSVGFNYKNKNLPKHISFINSNNIKNTGGVTLANRDLLRAT